MDVSFSLLSDVLVNYSFTFSCKFFVAQKIPRCCSRCRKCGTGGYLLTFTSNREFDSCATDFSVLTNQHGPVTRPRPLIYFVIFKSFVDSLLFVLVSFRFKESLNIGKHCFDSMTSYRMWHHLLSGWRNLMLISRINVFFFYHFEHQIECLYFCLNWIKFKAPVVPVRSEVTWASTPEAGKMKHKLKESFVKIFI